MATYESKKYKFTGAQLTDLAAPNMADGTVSDEEFQRLDGVTSDIQTQIDAGLGSGGGTMTGDLAFGDNVLAKFGASNDLQIFHDGNNSIVKDVGTGDLVLGGDNVQITNAGSGHNHGASGTFSGSSADRDWETKSPVPTSFTIELLPS